MARYKKRNKNMKYYTFQVPQDLCKSIKVVMLFNNKLKTYQQFMEYAIELFYRDFNKIDEDIYNGLVLNPVKNLDRTFSFCMKFTEYRKIKSEVNLCCDVFNTSINKAEYYRRIIYYTLYRYKVFEIDVGNKLYEYVDVITYIQDLDKDILQDINPELDDTLLLENLDDKSLIIENIDDKTLENENEEEKNLNKEIDMWDLLEDLQEEFLEKY